MTAVSDVTDTILQLRAEVCALHEQLTRYQLVVWTAGNVSAHGCPATTCWSSSPVGWRTTT